MKEKVTQMNEVLSSIQRELKAPKNQRNGFGNYNYRSAEDILEAVKKLLPNGVYLTIADKIVVKGERVYVKATATISNGTDAVQSVAYAREPEVKKGMDEAQITGATSSYARKYALNGLFCIDDTKDADTQPPVVQAKAIADDAFKRLLTKDAEFIKKIKDSNSYSFTPEQEAKLIEAIQ